MAKRFFNHHHGSLRTINIICLGSWPLEHVILDILALSRKLLLVASLSQHLSRLDRAVRLQEKKRYRKNQGRTVWLTHFFQPQVNLGMGCTREHAYWLLSLAPANLHAYFADCTLQIVLLFGLQTVCAGKYNFNNSPPDTRTGQNQNLPGLLHCDKDFGSAAGPFHQTRPPSPPLCSTHQTENHTMEKLITLWRDDKACIDRIRRLRWRSLL